MPCGLISRIRISIDERTDLLDRGRHAEQRPDLDHDPDDHRADERAPDGAETTEGDRGEHEQQELEAHQEVDLAVDGQQHAGQRR